MNLSIGNRLLLSGLIVAIICIFLSFIYPPIPKPIFKFDISTARPITPPEGYELEEPSKEPVDLLEQTPKTRYRFSDYLKLKGYELEINPPRYEIIYRAGTGERYKWDPKTKVFYRLTDIERMQNTRLLIRVIGISGLAILLIALIMTNRQKIYARIKTWQTNYPLLLTSIGLFIGSFGSEEFLDLPYGYYQLLRFAVCGFGIYFAYLASQQDKKEWVWTLGIIALIFNPFVKFHFDASTWRLFDLIAGIIFAIASFKIKKHYGTERQN